MRWVVVALAGCFAKPDPPGGAGGDGGIGDGATADASPCVTPALHGFSGTTPCAPWGMESGTTNRVMTQSGGALIISPPPNQSSLGNCSSMPPVTFDEPGAFVAVDSVASG